MKDEEILSAAATILESRASEAAIRKEEETRRLYRKYASARVKLPHELGRPKLLSREEALLLVALERNRYLVEADCPNERNGGRWHGSALCKYNVREGAMSMLATSRHDLLLGLWASVSAQEGDVHILLTEEHLQGSLVQRHIRALWAEVKEQESMTTAEVGGER